MTEPTDLNVDELTGRIRYLRNALTPGTTENAGTTFYVGKGDAMRAEIKALQAELVAAARTPYDYDHNPRRSHGQDHQH